MRELRQLIEVDYVTWGDEQFNEQVKMLKMALDYALTANQNAGPADGIDLAISVVRSGVHEKNWFVKALALQMLDLNEKGVDSTSLRKSVGSCRYIRHAFERNELWLCEVSQHITGSRLLKGEVDLSKILGKLKRIELRGVV